MQHLAVSLVVAGLVGRDVGHLGQGAIQTKVLVRDPVFLTNAIVIQQHAMHHVSRRVPRGTEPVGFDRLQVTGASDASPGAGSVESEARKQLAEEIARDTEGVTRVVNRLTVDASAAARQ